MKGNLKNMGINFFNQKMLYWKSKIKVNKKRLDFQALFCVLYTAIYCLKSSTCLEPSVLSISSAIVGRDYRMTLLLLFSTVRLSSTIIKQFYFNPMLKQHGLCVL